MNNDIVEPTYQQVREQTRKWWGKLTGEDLERVAGKAERLADALQNRYGYIRSNAESQSIRWMHDHQGVPAAQA